MEILTPKSQLYLFGYDKIFNSFIALYKKNKLPNVMLFSGPKGSGKSTFSYHFINYLLSQNEQNKYLVENFKIDPNNLSFKLTQNNLHPNFFLLENDSIEENIKIDQARNLIKFLNKSTFSKDLKLVLIDNAEYLNQYSSNALLKSLEEPSKNTFIIIIHNDASPITETMESRCIKFKFYFNILEKRDIFIKIAQDYRFDFNNNDIDKFFHFLTPGSLLKYLIALKDSNFNIFNDRLSCILFLIDKYKAKKDSELFNLITLLIENFYNELSLNDSNNINNYFLNKSKIAYLVNDMKKFNLDKKNLLITIDGILKNEA